MTSNVLRQALSPAVLLFGLASTGVAQTSATGMGCLPGNWYLNNQDLFVAIVEGLKASDSGTDFTLSEIEGDYLANIDVEQGKLTVTWDDWVMRGIAKTRNGTFDVTMRLNGNQYYDIATIDDQNMAVSLTGDAMNATVTFAGMSVSDPDKSVPRFSGGAWNCQVDTLAITSDMGKWTFQRADF
ncbi:MAG: hypothetical protein Kow0058_00370 [Roseovarius sp.]